jgi:hypothetical protein
LDFEQPNLGAHPSSSQVTFDRLLSGMMQLHDDAAHVELRENLVQHHWARCGEVSEDNEVNEREKEIK